MLISGSENFGNSSQSLLSEYATLGKFQYSWLNLFFPSEPNNFCYFFLFFNLLFCFIDWQYLLMGYHSVNDIIHARSSSCCVGLLTCLVFDASRANSLRWLPADCICLCPAKSLQQPPAVVIGLLTSLWCRGQKVEFFPFPYCGFTTACVHLYID